MPTKIHALRQIPGIVEVLIVHIRGKSRIVIRGPHVRHPRSFRTVMARNSSGRISSAQPAGVDPLSPGSSIARACSDGVRGTATVCPSATSSADRCSFEYSPVGIVGSVSIFTKVVPLALLCRSVYAGYCSTSSLNAMEYGPGLTLTVSVFASVSVFDAHPATPSVTAMIPAASLARTPISIKPCGLVHPRSTR